MEAKYFFGIDLGTTYSVISYLDDNGLIQTCKNEEGSQITPSVVDLSGAVPVVGDVAKDNKVFAPHSVLDHFKREMDQGHAPKYYGEAYDKTTTAIDLSAEVLKYLARYASDETGSLVGAVVITVPAYFGTEQKAATKEAAVKAGFNEADVYLIEEPTAAAVYYGYKGDKKETVMVYDLGGGTFDVVAVDIDGYKYDCCVVDGDVELGGKEWDQCMMDIITGKLMEKGIDVTSLSEDDLAEIQLAAEKAKKALTPSESTNVSLKLEAGKAQLEVTREEFEALSMPLLNRTIERTRAAKEKAESLGKTITKILLVGGSSYMPQVQERLTAEFPDVEVPNPMDPNMAVSKGAAFYGKSILAHVIAMKQNEAQTVSENGEPAAAGDDGEALGGFVIGPATETVAENTKFEIGTEVIEIKKVSVSSIGLRGMIGNVPKIMTLLKRGETLPLTKDIDIPLNANALKVGRVDLQLYEHRSEEQFVDLDEPNLKEMEKQTGAISTGLPEGSVMHIHLEINDEGLLILIATDPNGESIGLSAQAEAKSADA